LSGGVVTWALGSLNAGATGQVSYTVLVSDALSTGAIITNATYSIDSDQSAPLSGSQVYTTVYSCAPAASSGDVNGDGSVDVLDAIKVIRITLGLQ